MSEGVDVVIPAYNAQQYLREAIASVIAQTAPVARIIVVDDGSTDATCDIARGCGPRVEVHRQPNLGAAAARNAGIARCDAALVAFLDADDRWLPRRLAGGVVRLAADPALGFVCTRLRTFASPELAPDEQARLRAGNAELQDGWIASALTVRRAVLAQVGAFAEDLRVAETIDWFSRARAMGVRGEMLADVLVERRLHLANATRRAAGHHDYLVAARRHLERVRRNGAGSAE